MEKFSLTSLFSGTGAEKNIGNSGEINIVNMFKTSATEIRHDSKELLEITKKKRQKVSELYNNEYNLCWEQIYESNNYNLQHVIYTVPKFNIECDLYNPLICMQYIQKKLKFHKIGSTFISNTKMFITWHNLENLLSDNKI
jgi:hypothetical protein